MIRSTVVHPSITGGYLVTAHHTDGTLRRYWRPTHAWAQHTAAHLIDADDRRLARLADRLNNKLNNKLNNNLPTRKGQQ